MFHKYFLLYLAVSYVKLCGGQVIQFGSCAIIQPMPYFDLERFLGEWYEIERFPHWYEHNGQCAFLRLQYCDQHIEIEHNYVRDGIQFVLQRNSSYIPGDEAIFFTDSTNIDPVGIPLSVISTDYSTYAVVYGCKYNDLMGIRYISAWILSRTSSLPDETLRQATNELTSIPGANFGYLEKVDQRDRVCDYYWTAVISAEAYTDSVMSRSLSENGIFSLI